MDSASAHIDPAVPGLSILVVAGEASGDLHAAQLCRQIQSRTARSVQFWGSGGSQLAALGARLLASSHDLAAIGPVAAAGLWRRYWRLYRSILREAESRRPDLAILVDFPDFNLPLARALKKRGVAPLVYFISPQLWAWREGRVGRIRRTIDKMIVLFPFEVDFYRRHGIEADYFGHPLAAQPLPEPNREQFAQRYNLDPGDVFVAVLPGSRSREVEVILPLVLAAARRMDPGEQKRLQLVISPAPGTAGEVNALLSREAGPVKVTVAPGSAQALAHCDYAVVKSGTSTLEAALAEVPFCVVYRGSRLSWNLVRFLIKAEFFALPNLVLKEAVVPELIQEQANPQAVAKVLCSFVRRDQKWETIRQRLRRVREKLVAEDPYGNAAKSVLRLIEGGL
ncbi:MAG: lipid-A-disaccharide synthase [Acidobacteria bacterium]|nr:lipid-A-disaccharide synthase [Acidobacteriota bacterium]